MVTQSVFCTSISCMDGRIQLPIIQWLKENHNVSFVDTITEPGIEKLFTNVDKINEIKSKALISVEKHGSKLVMVSGHNDCAGNPVSESEHIDQIRQAVSVIESWKLPIKVIGAWVNHNWELEILA
ncbi:MAG TPA: carbonic anhydrase [Candidatus Nitrosotalea sp.]|nr:carbonic anhydrase [Candidatus Nitrosotalea sp.]